MLFVKIAFADFTITAESERSLYFYLDYKTIRAYYENLDIYPKFFPNMDSVKAKDSIESFWSYKIDYPMSPAWDVTFNEIKQVTPDSILIFESKNPEKNYLYWKAVFSPYNEKQTTVKIDIKVRLTREKASDIHFLAGIVGAGYINSKMKDKIDEDLDEFFAKTSKDMYAKSKNLTNEK
jgi:uncharacterized membrane protein